MACELMESLKLNNNPEIDGYYGCSESLKQTSEQIIEYVKPKAVE